MAWFVGMFLYLTIMGGIVLVNAKIDYLMREIGNRDDR